MKTYRSFFTPIAALLFALGMFTGCESSDSGSSQTTTNVYYGTGFYDPWYYGHCHDDDDIIVAPPPSDRPDWGGGDGARPSHPIARPPQGSRPSARPTPSIPSGPRPSARPSGGGGRRR